MLKNLKYFLLKLNCKSNSIVNHQLDQLMKNYFTYSTKIINIFDKGFEFCNLYRENVIESKYKYFAFDLSGDFKKLLGKKGINLTRGEIVKDNFKIKREFLK